MNKKEILSEENIENVAVFEETESNTDSEFADMSEEELMSLLQAQNNNSEEFCFDPIPIDTCNVEELQYDAVTFNQGIEDMSYVCGQLTALKNLGMSWEDVIAVFGQTTSIEANIMSLDMSNKSQEQIAKVNSKLNGLTV